MNYYPVCLNIKDKNCLVVGGGGVAVRKVKTLVACGARVTVVTLAAEAALVRLAKEGGITLFLRPYAASDLDGMFLVIGATSDTALNFRISEDADRKNMLCNIADVPDACNFILPAVVQQGDLQIAVSTSGKSPAFAKHLRKELEQQFGAEYAAFLALMGEIRTVLLAQAHAPEAHKGLFEGLIAAGLLDMIRGKQTKAIDALLEKTLGSGFSLERLGIEI
ncbi:MAG: precorrin-2 dehydrogenase/sirohydrochlorin ferrochelatase family protein [Thermodesulfobacteriota bacterium]